MRKYENILIPVDFSEASRFALSRTLEQESTSGATITVVHVVDYMPPTYIRPEIPEIYASEDLMKQRAQKHLDEFIEETGLTGCNSIVKFGHAKTCILTLLQEKNYDLVILARHKRSGLQKLLGSVSNGIANEATCDVLIVHE